MGRKRKKAAKEEKDPNKPKEASTPYFIFLADERPRVVEQHSDYTPTLIAKELGLRWKSLPEDVKKKYKADAKQQKADYQVAMREYLTGGKYREWIKKKKGDGNESSESEVEYISSDDENSF